MKNKELKRIFSLVFEYKLSFFSSILFALLYSLSSLLIPLFTGRAIDCVIGEGNVDFPSLFLEIIYIAIFIAVAFFSSFFMARINNKISYAVSRKLREDAFNKISTLPFSYLDRRQTGDTLSRIVNDTESVSDGLILGFSQLFSGIITILGTLVLLFSLNITLALVVLLVTPLSLFVASFISKKTQKLYRIAAEDRSRLTEITDESVKMLSEIKVYNAEKKIKDNYERINESYAKSSFKATFYSSITNPSTRFVNSIVYALTALAGALLTLSGRISVGLMSASLSYANQYTKPFNEISGVIAEFQNALASASRIFAFLDEREEDKSGESDIGKARGDFSFNNVSFSYNKDEELIKGFNFASKSGDSVAIVGPTGSGKTTIINLIMRFYDTDGGSISLDGKDLKTISRKSLRKNIGMVLQDTYILNRSVKDNILMGRDFPLEKVKEAARLSYADSFIERLPNGYDTVLSDSSSALSQGERQLLSIARVMLDIPSILILDEATSNIDTRTEILIQKSFARLSKDKTIFAVAHRLSTIENSDYIICLKDGKVVESGNHKELIDKKGFYFDLYQSQFA